MRNQNDEETVAASDDGLSVKSEQQEERKHPLYMHSEEDFRGETQYDNDDSLKAQARIFWILGITGLTIMIGVIVGLYIVLALK
mmetsp:Transcript_17039/g.24625  ORF Transcript_17039/g.24625 Transcript_17039/m.24625 type:complete len:84 (-) Transcript_17039:421-672(-)